MHCFYLYNKPLAFYVQKISQQRTLPDTLSHKLILLPFKTNNILHSDAYQSCVERQVHFLHKPPIFDPKKNVSKF